MGLRWPRLTHYGIAPGGNWRRMPFLSCDFGAEQPLLDADVIGVGSIRDAVLEMERVPVAQLRKLLATG